MSLNKGYKYVAILLLLGVSMFFCFPFLFSQTISWQIAFNQAISGHLHQIKQSPIQAGLGLIVMSFLYGILHALGPGHGKFVIASYLSTHQTKLKTSMKLTLVSSFMQGMVAVIATSIIIVGLRLSSQYFKLSQLWLERSAFILMFLLGGYWIYQSAVAVYLNSQQNKKNRSAVKIYTIKPITKNTPHPFQPACQHKADCRCGHQHLPNSQQLSQATDFKSRFFVVLTIGMRPCSGAIFILFLSYMLDLYKWGIIAAIAMAIGTGITLSLFALLVQYARHTAIRLGNWYLSVKEMPYAEMLVKFIAGIIVVFFAVTLFYGTTLPVRGGALLF